jgi:hypothetical protein
MNLALKDIRHNLGRFALTTIGVGMLLMIVMGMGGIYRGHAIRTPEGWRLDHFRLEERSFDEAAARLTAHIERVDAAPDAETT